jgi:glycosyltransferase involved in cell wall biosynthesis
MRDFELILLDDCSSDASRDVLAKFARECGLPVRTVFNEKNSGSPFVQWRRGAEMATGEFLWIAESDDAAGPDFLRATLAAAERHPTAGLVYCQSRIVDENGADCGDNLAYTEELWPGRWAKDFAGSGREECGRYLSIINTIPNASAVLVRREALLATDRTPETMRLAGDWMVWAQILMRADVAFVAEAHNRFRRHSATVRSTTVTTRMLDECARVRLFIADGFRGDAEVLGRMGDQTLREWRRWAWVVEATDSLAWFRRHHASLAVFGRAKMRPIVPLYLKYRLLHMRLLAPLRRTTRAAAEP